MGLLTSGCIRFCFPNETISQMNYRFPKRDTAVGWQVSAAAYYLLRTQDALSGIRIEMKKRKGELLYYVE